MFLFLLFDIFNFLHTSKSEVKTEWWIKGKEYMLDYFIPSFVSLIHIIDTYIRKGYLFPGRSYSNVIFFLTCRQNSIFKINIIFQYNSLKVMAKKFFFYLNICTVASCTIIKKLHSLLEIIVHMIGIDLSE